jgi:uncharacterized protein
MPGTRAAINDTQMPSSAEITEIREDRIGLFRNLEGPDTHSRFFDRVAEDVDWTVEGTHPIAGRYHGKQDFIHRAFGRWGPILRGGLKMTLEHIYVDGDTTIVELLSTSTSVEGAPFSNRYCWVCRFSGETIVEVRAYFDTMMVTYTMLRNERALSE